MITEKESEWTGITLREGHWSWHKHSQRGYADGSNRTKHERMLQKKGLYNHTSSNSPIALNTFRQSAQEFSEVLKRSVVKIDIQESNFLKLRAHTCPREWSSIRHREKSISRSPWQYSEKQRKVELVRRTQALSTMHSRKGILSW